MRRYVALPHPSAAWSENLTGWVGERPFLDVWEQDKAPQFTGLLDAHDVPLYRVQERAALGFDLTEESNV